MSNHIIIILQPRLRGPKGKIPETEPFIQYSYKGKKPTNKPTYKPTQSSKPNCNGIKKTSCKALEDVGCYWDIPCFACWGSCKSVYDPKSVYDSEDYEMEPYEEESYSSEDMDSEDYEWEM
jgi:hypothetical protein